jgi:hypothetical protein
VDSHRFLELLTTGKQLEELDYHQLTELRSNFPYFHLAHGLAAKYEFERNGGNHGDSLALAALSSPDRQALKKWLESPAERKNHENGGDVALVGNPENPIDSESTTSSEGSQSSQITEEKPSEELPQPEKKKRRVTKDELIESIKKREKREIVDIKKKEQIDLIREFNKKDFKMAAIREIEANQPTENLADASTRLNDNLVSETFARILTKQGKKDTAIEIYEKLALKFPDKRAYFADLIEKLKE